MFVASRYATDKWSCLNFKLRVISKLFSKVIAMDIGHFYFLDDNYYTDFSDSHLMGNHERDVLGDDHNRPFFVAIQDDAKTNIFWLVPCTTKVLKFRNIYHHKISKYGQCDTLVFGQIRGVNNCFLIQNMCPVTSKYIKNKYLDNSGCPVQISNNLLLEIQKKAKKILALVKNGNTNLVFPDVMDIYGRL